MKIKNLVKVIISSLLSVIGFITVSNSFQTVKAKEQNYSFSIGDFSKKEKTISFESFLENDLSTNDEINKVDVIDLDLSADIGAVNAYMQLAYRYKKAGGVYSEVDFRMMAGVADSIDELGSYTRGIKVSANGKDEYYPCGIDEDIYHDEDEDIYYVVIDLGDVINNYATRAIVDFTVCSYIEDESSKKYCGPVKTFSVVDMIESYYVMDDYKSQVKDCFNGLNNASKITLPSFNAGTTFNSSTLPVPTDATYTITYDCEDAGIFNATAPTANGKGWTMTITINKDDADNIFSVTSNWFLFIEKAEAVVTFSKSFENGARFTSDQLPTVTVSEGATYTVTYDCGDADITGATAPAANGYGWKIVVTVNEDDTYAAKSVKSKWFRFVKDAEVTIQSFESGATFNASTLPTVTVSDGADFDITYDCGDAGIKGAISPVANGKGWKVVVTVKQDGIFNGSVTKSTGWFRYLEIPTITFSNTEAGLTLGEVPTYTVSPTEAEMQEYKNSAFTGYSITVTYDCEGAGLSNESKPLDNGQGWVMKVKISRSNYNEKVTVISKWFYYKPEGNAN